MEQRLRGDRVTVALRRALPEDRDAVVRALARAFDKDPVANFLLRQDHSRERAFNTVFDVAFRRLTLPLRETWMSSGGEGAALWTPPKGWKTIRGWPNIFGLAHAVGITRVPRVLAAIHRVQSEHPREPHWYLFALGVVPEAQGRGLGSALLRAVLSRCDERHEPAYLEASTEDNVRLYLRHGFRLVKEVALAPGGPIVRLMWRDAPP
jgi:ribosomal protein S18 acetylase RimI-like enzyme